MALGLEEARSFVCRPYPGAARCSKLLGQLRRHGVRAVLAPEPWLRAGRPLLGTGTSSNVFLAEAGWGLAAIKALRPDTPRATLLHEVAMQLRAADLGAAPPVYDYDTLFIASKPLLGGSLAAAARAGAVARPQLRLLLVKAYALDLQGINHNELALPHSQVLFDEDGEPFIIDYESATVAAEGRACNLTQLVGGLARLGLLEVTRQAREALREYKRSPPKLLHAALEKVLDALGL